MEAVSPLDYRTMAQRGLNDKTLPTFRHSNSYPDGGHPCLSAVASVAETSSRNKCGSAWTIRMAKVHLFYETPRQGQNILLLGEKCVGFKPDVFGNSLSLVHNYKSAVFQMAPFGKKQAKKQVNHIIYALFMLQLVYVMIFLSLKLCFSHCSLCPASALRSFSALFFRKQTHRTKWKSFTDQTKKW